jgi:uncharacterized protein YbbC (DUF1343 family)/CubicO group peptidase (beta-lactamase class C family)
MITAACLLLRPASAQFSSNQTFTSSKLKELNQTLADAVQRREIPGAVVWMERRGKRWGNEFGYRAVDPEKRAMNIDTIFDAASLTKVMATTPAVWLLVEDGKLDLDAPASRWIPEFTGDGKEKITLRQMLTHTSGLRPGLMPSGEWAGYEVGLAKIVAQSVQTKPNTEFRYSDLNFILLGEIVRRVSGESLDQFTKHRIFKPLAMEDTGFLPSPLKKDRIAPTTREGEVVIQGVVHDPTSRRMGGVTGHAGLFTNARDAGRYCRMLLDGGKTPDGRVILKKATVSQMTAVQPPLPGGVRRTLGFDVLSAFSDPKGAHFGPRSYGHTGWTGGCLWIDPDADCYFVLLTNRNHPSEGKSIKNLRWQVATLAAEAMGVARRVSTGVDKVEAEGWSALAGQRIGLITNQTGVTSEGQTTLAVLQKVPGAKVTRLFSPEHGIAGTEDRGEIADSSDPVSGLPVTSLYGKDRKPTPDSLKDVDVLVFDIQDIGTRFYTYISTMLNCMESAAAAHLPFIVLDRVNPLGGQAVEGPLPVDVKNAFVACHNIPIRHGLTTGELARLLVKERLPGLKLSVVPVKDWERRQAFPQTLLPWVNPSPNMRSPEAALLYPGIGLLEMANISVGRGTDMPFCFLGAPWMDSKAVAASLMKGSFPGVLIQEIDFKPDSSKFAHELCHGLHFSVTDSRVFQPVRLGIGIAMTLWEVHGDLFELDKVNGLLFHPATLQAIRDKKTLQEITALWEPDQAAFRQRCADILLYPDTNHCH